MIADMQKRAGPWLRMVLGGWYRSGGKGFDVAVITDTERGKLAHIWRGDDVDLEEVFCGPVDAFSHDAKAAADKALLKDGWLLALPPNPILCEHANEVPAQCGCQTDCYCKSHTCRPIVNSLGEQIGTLGAPLGKEVP